MVTMLAYSHRMNVDPIDPVGLGRDWSDRLDTMLTTLLKDRDLVEGISCIDIRFDDFMADELGVAATGLRARRRAADRRGALLRWPTISPATSAAGSAGSRRRARCSDWTRTDCARDSRRTWGVSWLRSCGVPAPGSPPGKEAASSAISMAKVTLAVRKPHARTAKPSQTTGSESPQVDNH